MSQYLPVESHPWVKQARQSMPKLRPRIMVRYCTNECYIKERLPENFGSSRPKISVTRKPDCGDESNMSRAGATLSGASLPARLGNSSGHGTHPVDRFPSSKLPSYPTIRFSPILGSTVELKLRPFSHFYYKAGNAMTMEAARTRVFHPNPLSSSILSNIKFSPASFGEINDKWKRDGSPCS
jgi:hypothetical protein